MNRGGPCGHRLHKRKGVHGAKIRWAVLARGQNWQASDVSGEMADGRWIGDRAAEQRKAQSAGSAGDANLIRGCRAGHARRPTSMGGIDELG